MKRFYSIILLITFCLCAQAQSKKYIEANNKLAEKTVEKVKLNYDLASIEIYLNDCFKYYFNKATKLKEDPDGLKKELGQLEGKCNELKNRKSDLEKEKEDLLQSKTESIDEAKTRLERNKLWDDKISKIANDTRRNDSLAQVYNDSLKNLDKTELTSLTAKLESLRNQVKNQQSQTQNAGDLIFAEGADNDKELIEELYEDLINAKRWKDVVDRKEDIADAISKKETIMASPGLNTKDLEQKFDNLVRIDNVAECIQNAINQMKEAKYSKKKNDAYAQQLTKASKDLKLGKNLSGELTQVKSALEEQENAHSNLLLILADIQTVSEAERRNTSETYQNYVTAYVSLYNGNDNGKYTEYYSGFNNILNGINSALKSATAKEFKDKIQSFIKNVTE